MRILIFILLIFLTKITFSQEVPDYIASCLLTNPTINIVSLTFFQDNIPLDSNVYNKSTNINCYYWFKQKRKKFKTVLQWSDTIAKDKNTGVFINTDDISQIRDQYNFTKYYYDSNKRLTNVKEQSHPMDQGIELDSTVFYYDRIGRLFLITTFYLQCNMTYRNMNGIEYPCEKVISNNDSIVYNDSTDKINRIINYYKIENDNKKYIEGDKLVEYKGNFIVLRRLNSNDIYCRINYK